MLSDEIMDLSIQWILLTSLAASAMRLNPLISDKFFLGIPLEPPLAVITTKIFEEMVAPF